MTNEYLYRLYLAAFAAFSQGEKVSMPTEPAPIHCGDKMVARHGGHGRFWGCGRFPQCHFTQPMKAMPTEAFWALATAAAQTDQKEPPQPYTATEFFQRLNTALVRPTSNSSTAPVQDCKRAEQEAKERQIRQEQHLEEAKRHLEVIANVRQTLIDALINLGIYFKETTPATPGGGWNECSFQIIAKAAAKAMLDSKARDTRRAQLLTDILLERPQNRGSSGGPALPWNEILVRVRAAATRSSGSPNTDLVHKFIDFAEDLIQMAQQGGASSVLCQGIRNIASSMINYAAGGDLRSQVKQRQDPLIGRADELGSKAGAVQHMAKGIFPKPLCGAPQLAPQTTVFEHMTCAACLAILDKVGVIKEIEQVRAINGAKAHIRLRIL